MSQTDQYLTLIRLLRLGGSFLSLMLLLASSTVFAHGGHGDEFQGENRANQTSTAISVEPETLKRLGIIIQPVTKKRINGGIKTTGQIETLPNQQVELTTPVEGAKVVELLVEPGDSVKFGQPVAVLYSPQLVELRVSSQEKRAEAQGELQQAEADLELARQNYEKFSQIARDEIAQAKSQLAFTQEKYEKDQQLAGEGALPRRDALESETEFKEAQANLTRALSRRDVIDAEAQLKRAQASVAVAQSRLNLSDKVYQTRLAQLETRANAKGLVTVMAPIVGRVADREVTLGQSFQDAGGKLMTIINDNRVYAIANIFEKDLGKVKIGQEIRVKVASVANRTFNGRITSIGSVVQGETRIVSVRAQIDNPDGILKPGMFAELEVLSEQTATPVLAIPDTAVVEVNGKQLVYLQNGNSFQPVEVILGETAGDLVMVKSGLFEGDRIVTQRAPQLYAQSLRSDNSLGKEKEEQSEIIPTSNEQTSFPLSGWLIGAGGGLVIGILAFTVGVLAGRRTHSRLVNARDVESNAIIYETEVYPDKK